MYMMIFYIVLELYTLCWNYTFDLGSTATKALFFVVLFTIIIGAAAGFGSSVTGSIKSTVCVHDTNIF